MTIKDIPGLEGKYQVSDEGHVFSTLKHNEGKQLKPSLGPSDNLYVVLKGKRHAVARIVLETFMGPPPEGLKYAVQINGVKTDNRLENLRWGKLDTTPKTDRVRLTEHTALRILEALEEGTSVQDVAKLFNCAEVAVSKVASGQTWRYLSREPYPNLQQIAQCRKRISRDEAQRVWNALTVDKLDPLEVADQLDVPYKIVKGIAYGGRYPLINRRGMKTINY